MPYTLYPKPYRSPGDLVADLQAKHLQFQNTADAEQILSQISYHHFKIYLHPFLNSASPGGKHYRPTAFFEHGIQIYRFDEELRAYLFKVIARLEVKLRSRLDHTLAAHSNNPFWYLDNTFFLTTNGTQKLDAIRSRIASEFLNSKEAYAHNYKAKYFNETHDNFKQLPPFWIASEFLTIGALQKIYSVINNHYFYNLPGTASNTLQRLAAEFGARKFSTLSNWVTVLRDVRNKCAHHSRLWNVNLPAPKDIMHLLTVVPLQTNRLYNALVVMNQMIKTLGITSLDFFDTIDDLIQQYPAIQPYLRSAGFAHNWRADPFWH
ncbi:Abi family protein [Photorhabdus temperata]|uniref:DNA-binding protein n=1 Tax=Photorhabdus temperata J3 TaxID=1389415 RepID=U7R0B1_PHOTE|nr:Abi family protein [Photorhabdus temperata]ERT12256.1 hypothetical protein O185_15065 [Photorhabdus temperata J3]